MVAGLLLLLIYYAIVWSAVGRDPARGVIMPLYEPPANLSPAAMRYLIRMDSTTSFRRGDSGYGRARLLGE